MKKYKVDLSSYSNIGGYSTLFILVNNPKLAFKEYISKKRAKIAYSIQKKLNKYDLAPKIYTKVCRLSFDESLLQSKTGWGFVTELAVIRDKISLKKIQELVDEIKEKADLDFWDCHAHNMGYVIRYKKKKLVCIDTGLETWDGKSNYYGNSSPGPKCCYCLKYKCQCIGD